MKEKKRDLLKAQDTSETRLKPRVQTTKPCFVVWAPFMGAVAQLLVLACSCAPLLYVYIVNELLNIFKQKKDLWKKKGKWKLLVVTWVRKSEAYQIRLLTTGVGFNNLNMDLASHVFILRTPIKKEGSLESKFVK